MFLTISNSHTGEVYISRRLAPRESLDCEYHAKKWAESDNGLPLDFSADGVIPAGCADVEVEITRKRNSPGSCWERADYFFSSES